MDILKFPHPSLFKPCVPVTVFDAELKVLLEAMWETMIAERGVGLAANQVGLPWRMFTMKGPDEEKLFLVNPKIVASSMASANMREGCLSAPGEFVTLLERAAWVQVEYWDETGERRVRVFMGVHSVCAQHELDHLDGKSHLQSKSIPKSKRLEIAKRWGFKIR